MTQPNDLFPSGWWILPAIWVGLIVLGAFVLGAVLF